MQYVLQIFGATYGQGAYGSSTYGCVQGDTACLAGQAAATTTTSGAASGGLTNTGVILVGIVTLACVLIFAALLVRFWQRKRRVQYSAR